MYREKDGFLSIGLFQISYRNQWHYGLEPLASAKVLEDPLVNIRSAVKIMAYLVDKDGVIASGSGDNSLGGARFWSTLRDAAPRGRLAEIKRMVIRFDTPRHDHLDIAHGDSG